MAWQGIEGHDDVAEKFRTLLSQGRLASTFLFVGPAGIGKRTFALGWRSRCSVRPDPFPHSIPAAQCAGCQQVLAGTHPDLLRIAQPADKSFIPVELFIGSKEKRMQEGLCHDISLKPFMGGRRVAIIDDADYLNEEGANSLLKTLEEPPPAIGADTDRHQRRSAAAHDSLARSIDSLSAVAGLCDSRAARGRQWYRGRSDAGSRAGPAQRR